MVNISNEFTQKLEKFKGQLKETLGDTIRKPISAKLGYQDEDGQVFLKVPETIAEQDSQYYFSAAGGQTYVGQAYLQENVIADWQLRYGTPIRVKKDPLNGTWEIIGLDVIYSSEYFRGVDPETIVVVPLRRFEPGLLTSTQPQSMQAQVYKGAYDVGDTFKFYPTQKTINWGEAPHNANVPEDGLCRFVLVQIDPETGVLSYKYGAETVASMTFEQAYQYQINNSIATLLPEKDAGQFRCGYIKLVGGQDFIDRRDHIWSIQQVLGAPSSSNANELAESILSRIVVAGDEVVTSDGEVVWAHPD